MYVAKCALALANALVLSSFAGRPHWHGPAAPFPHEEHTFSTLHRFWHAPADPAMRARCRGARGCPSAPRHPAKFHPHPPLSLTRELINNRNDKRNKEAYAQI